MYHIQVKTKLRGRKIFLSSEKHPPVTPSASLVGISREMGKLVTLSWENSMPGNPETIDLQFYESNKEIYVDILPAFGCELRDVQIRIRHTVTMKPIQFT